MPYREPKAIPKPNKIYAHLIIDPTQILPSLFPILYIHPKISFNFLTTNIQKLQKSKITHFP